MNMPAHYAAISAAEQLTLQGGDIAETVDTLYKVGRVFTYVGRIFTAIGTMFNSIKTIYTSVVNLNNYVKKNF